MKTLTVKTDNVIKNPQYGKMLDLLSGLRIELDARNLNLPNGATVNNWVGGGAGAESERTFNNKLPTYNYPTFSTTDIPSVRFSGTNMLKNSNTNPVEKATYVCVMKWDDMKPSVSGVSRLFAGEGSAPRKHTVLPYNNNLRQAAGINADGSGGEKFFGEFVPAPTGEWFVGVFTFDGSNSKMYLSSSNAFVTSDLNASNQTIIVIGTAEAEHQNSAFKGSIAYFSQYDRILSDEDIVAVADHHAMEFGI